MPKLRPGNLQATYLPCDRRLFIWDAARTSDSPAWPDCGVRTTRGLLLPKTPSETRRPVRGRAVEVGDAVELLVSTRSDCAADTRHALADSTRTFAAASRLLLELIARGNFTPVAEPGEERRSLRLSWTPIFETVDDRRRRLDLARALPPAGVCAPETVSWEPVAVLDRFWADASDSLVRRAATVVAMRSGWEVDFAEHLGSGADPEWDLGTPELALELTAWLPRPEPAEVWVAHAALQAPPCPGNPWQLTYALHSQNTGATIDAGHLQAGRSQAWHDVLRRARQALSTLLETDADELTTAQAWRFVATAHRTGGNYSGIELEVPPDLELTEAGSLEVLVRVDEDPEAPRAAWAQHESLLQHMAHSRLGWEVRLGERTLDAGDLAAFQAANEPLVHLRDHWVAVDPLDLTHLKTRVGTRQPQLAPGEVIAAVLSGEVPVDNALTADVVASAEVARLAHAIRRPALSARPTPATLEGALRPYQARGLDWLLWLEAQGLGGILADDMGLGKGVQAIALMVAEPGPTLVVCPTGVLGNWERELARFAPSLTAVRHHGPTRVQDPATLRTSVNDRSVVITTYALLRRDVAVLSGPRWQRIVLDEAQHAKNPQSETAQAARALGAQVRNRLALTGTPVENDLTDLWSILEFCNPGLLGPVESFRRRFAEPIERGRDAETARRLRLITRPFVLRRSKTDGDVVTDLPGKYETVLYCNLTPEQADLYTKAADLALKEIARATGIARRGRILALITKLKQICDHPRLVVRTGASAATPTTVERSGKLAHLVESLDEVRASGDRSLVFTQYVAMGEILAAVLGAPFYHGGLSRARRDEIVHDFQSGNGSPDALVVSVRAGGLGLNLTAATRVFHYDRWWNPAVEDQATDRAHRIGQSADVWVHKLVCLGTLEERIDASMQRKRNLARTIVGTTPASASELSDEELAALILLEEEAVL